MLDISVSPNSFEDVINIESQLTNFEVKFYDFFLKQLACCNIELK